MEVGMGGMYYTLYLKSTLDKDLAVASSKMKRFEEKAKSTDKSLADLRRTGFALGEDLEKGATLASTFGATLMGVGVAADAAGLELGGMSQGFTILGGATLAAGTATRLATAGIKAYTAYATSEAIPTLQAQAAAAWAAHGPMIALAGVGALAFLAINRGMMDTTSSAKDNKIAVEELQQAYENLYEMEKEYAGIPEELSDLERDREQAVIDHAKALENYQDELNKRSRLEQELHDLGISALQAEESYKSALTTGDPLAIAAAESAKRHSLEAVASKYKELEIAGTPSDLELKSADINVRRAADRVSDIDRRVDELKARKEELAPQVPVLYAGGGGYAMPGYTPGGESKYKSILGGVELPYIGGIDILSWAYERGLGKNTLGEPTPTRKYYSGSNYEYPGSSVTVINNNYLTDASQVKTITEESMSLAQRSAAQGYNPVV